MNQKIGLVQTRGIGDIIIALPIADYFLKNGNEVVWPVDEHFLEMFRRAKPDIEFVGVSRSAQHSPGYFLHEPLELISQRNCGRTIILYSFLSGFNICDTRLSSTLKFDEYKYAIAGVPFDFKWHLQLERDTKREQALFDSLGIEGQYLLVHEYGSKYEASIPISADIQREYQVVRVDERTDSVFDWLLVIERASILYMIDSAMANLVEQLNLPNPKKLFLNADVTSTPVYKNGWQFAFLGPSDIISGH
jgi:hypothetical protein